jgi:uncharacterized protein YbjT (DUF2867 family)
MTASDQAGSAGQKRLVIVGASGMVGGYALRYALENPTVGSVTAIGRKTLGISHPKLKEVLHRDFADCSSLAETLSGQDAVAFCLGAYTGAVSDAELRTITVDYTSEFARVLHGSSPGAAFSFLSGNGADPTGRSRMPVARYKGEAENAVLAAGFPHVYVFRPAYIYPVEPRKEPNFSYRLLRATYPAFRILFPNQVIRADDLARAMVDAAVRGTGNRGPIFENRDIRALADSLLKKQMLQESNWVNNLRYSRRYPARPNHPLNASESTCSRGRHVLLICLRPQTCRPLGVADYLLNGAIWSLAERGCGS